MEIALMIASSFLTVIYIAVASDYFSERLTPRLPKLVHSIILVLGPAITNVLVTLYLNFPTLYVVLYVSLFLLFIVCFKIRFLQAVYCACFLTFNLLVIKGILYGIYCMVMDLSLAQAAGDVPLHYTMTIIACFIASAVMIIKKRNFPEEDEGAPRNQLMLTIVLHVIFAIMVFDTFSYTTSTNIFFFPLYHILLYCSLYLLFVVVYFYSSKVNRFKQQNEVLETQLSNQLENIRVQSDYIQNYRMLNDVFTSQVRGLKYVVDTNDLTKIKDYVNKLDESAHEMKALKTYSNNLLVDTILQSIATECEKSQISFDADLILPPSFTMKDYDLSAVFTHLMDNALMGAKSTQEPDHPFIRITTSNNGSWLSIIIENSYVPRHKSHALYGIQDVKSEGLALTESLLKKYDALLVLEPRMDIFSVTITYPLNLEKDR